MDSVKATLPRRLQQRIEGSRDVDLEVLCSALAAHFARDATCSQILEHLAHPTNTTCAKDSETAGLCKKEGNAAFGVSSFQQAIESYTKAIRYAPRGGDADDATLSTLFVNRAAALHALGLLDAAERDCTRGVQLQPEYSKAWYRRGRVWADLQNYGRATQDLEQALFLEKSAHGRTQVSRELDKVKQSVVDVAADSGMPDQSGSRVWKEGESASLSDKVRPHWTAEKQWGVEATETLHAGSLVLEEEAVAALLLKSHRNTHCHFCFEPLPPDPVACVACTIPLYCHEDCRSAACEELSLNFDGQRKSPGEHVSECGGASWSAALPTDAVLAARLLVRIHGNAILDKQLRELCHHYNELSGGAKVDLHVLAMVIANCISSRAVISIAPTVGDFAAKLIRLMAIVRANAMGIFSVRLDGDGASSSIDKSVVNGVEQVNVAQGIYLFGSKFNHSCSTNVHASFQNRRVKVRTIEPIQAGTPLELCYGPQVGEMSRGERQMWLQERYFFTCACLSCNTVVQPDLLLFAFRCSKVDCDGVVPGPDFLAQSDECGARAHHPTQVGTLKSGRCISCGTAIDLQHCSNAAKTVKMKLESLRSELQSPRSKDDSLLPGALDLLKQCQSIFHPSSKELAKAEDVVAQAYCSIGLPSDALPHCRLAIQILENIYRKDHIAVANERLKLASIAHAAGADEEFHRNLALVDPVMKVHHGDYRNIITVITGTFFKPGAGLTHPWPSSQRA